MRRAVLLTLLFAACDVGEVPTGGGGTPDAGEGGGGGGGGGGAGPDGGGGGAASSSLQISLTTSPSPNPVYNPNHVVAVWIEGAGGTFVKTIGRWANVRRTSLVAWQAKAGATDADAVSGATLNDHAAPLSVTWDLKDKGGTAVADGTYTIRMEVADSNATAPAQNNQGTFTFMKSAAPQSQNALANGGFSNVSIVFTP